MIKIIKLCTDNKCGVDISHCHNDGQIIVSDKDIEVSELEG